MKTMGFVAPLELQKDMGIIAKEQDRSIASVLRIMVTEQVKRSKAEGFGAIYYIEEGKHD